MSSIYSKSPFISALLLSVGLGALGSIQWAKPDVYLFK
jgi:hypothetical protein